MKNYKELAKLIVKCLKNKRLMNSKIKIGYKNLNRFEHKLDLMDANFCTTNPKSLKFNNSSVYYMPNCVDQSLEKLKILLGAATFVTLACSACNVSLIISATLSGTHSTSSPIAPAWSYAKAS